MTLYLQILSIFAPLMALGIIYFDNFDPFGEQASKVLKWGLILAALLTFLPLIIIAL